MIRFGIKSDFSISQSLLTVSKIVSHAKENDLKGVVISDDMTVSALPILSRGLAGTGIKTLFSVSVGVYDDPQYKTPSAKSGEIAKENNFCYLKLYAKNKDGIKEVYRLLTLANKPENFYYVPRVGIDDILNLNNVLISSGDYFSLFNHPKYEEIGQKLKDKFQKDFVCEIVPVNNLLFDKINRIAFDFAQKTKSEILFSFPALYERNDQISSLNVSRAIYRNAQITPERGAMLFLRQDKDLSIDLTETQLDELIEKLAKRIQREELLQFIGKTQELPEKWLQNYSYEFKKSDPCLPKMAEDEFDALVKECVKGWKIRLTKPILGYQPPASLLPTYKERLKYELSVIKKMNFSNYFLLVQHVVNWAKENGIFVGPARGSGAGSLVAYLMNITDIDPIRFNLIFERFINPERIDLPDIDMDYQSTRRQDVIDYLVDHFGADKVAGISNYTTLGSASAVRDCGRVFGLDQRALSVTKLMPKEHGTSFELEMASQTVPEIATFKKDNPKLWEHAVNVEGIIRSLGRHAAGVVVAGEPLTERSYVETRAGSPVVNWDKRIVEDMGLIKMDILGLSTLDTLQIAKQYVKESKGIDINYLELSLDDKDTLQAFGRGETTGVFQFESPGMKKLLKSLAENEPLTFEDVVAATALYRPGPMDSGLMDQYVKIKQGIQSPVYDHPNMENALKSTFGVLIYQEQLMAVARDVAGFTMGEADKLRKIVSKKKIAEMEAMESKFVEGAIEHSQMPEADAKALFAKIKAFASYGFNLSHALAYSVISYWACYMRTHYPAQYFSASLSITKEDKYAQIIKDAREAGVELLPPQINYSTDRFVVKDETKILAPFSSVKFISENISKKIVEIREKVGGKFESKEQFLKLAKARGSGVNARACTNLEKVGAFCELEPSSDPYNDISRRQDQKTLMGELIIDLVKINRSTELSTEIKVGIKKNIDEWHACNECTLCDKTHCNPSCGNKEIKFMVITDCPNKEEEAKGKFMSGKLASQLSRLMKEAGLDPQNGYYTGLVKAKKDDKFLSTEQISGCQKFIDKEIELLNPPVIIALGSASIRKFVKDGNSASMNGQAVYNPANNSTVICGISPAVLYFEESKEADLLNVFATTKNVIS